MSEFGNYGNEGYSTLPRHRELDPHYQIMFSIISRTVFNNTRKRYFHANTMKTYLRTSTWMMFCRSWKRPGWTRKYRLGYNLKNTTNESTESKLLLNRNSIMLVLVEIVIRNNNKKKLSSLNKVMSYKKKLENIYWYASKWVVWF